MGKVEEAPVLTQEQAENFMFDQLMTRRQKRQAMIDYHKLRIAANMRGFLEPVALIKAYDDLMRYYLKNEGLMPEDTDEDPED